MQISSAFSLLVLYILFMDFSNILSQFNNEMITIKLSIYDIP